MESNIPQAPKGYGDQTLAALADKLKEIAAEQIK